MLRSLALVVVVVLGVPALGRAQDVPAAPATSRAVPRSGGDELLWPAAAPTSAVEHPLLLRGHDMGLISTGIVGLSLGMIVGVVIASFDLAGGNCRDFTSPFFGSSRVECGTAPFALVPFAGSVVVGTVGLHGSVGPETIIPGVIAVAPQIVGLILLLVGLHGYTEDLASSDDLALSLSPLVSDSSLGASLRVSM